ncbi:expressed unknown protein [Seminavis robusta]|uniref:Transmembrane protein n=1 Tax=Seminavis robusta TaxID=568900 RepID=A0A9N8E2R9_9STRA|nr:expressed unknown protein [Seminavis robusta]|eukprot:Sro468_g149090.1 n/a (96) ;mRNA; f:22821-23108
MNKFFALVIAALFVVNGVTAFTSVKAPVSITSAPVSSFSPFVAETSTSLNLKVKVDPEQSKNRSNPAAMKGAAYGGSIAIAVLLPVAFLVWAATK